jgi:hypothetical protein
VFRRERRVRRHGRVVPPGSFRRAARVPILWGDGAHGRSARRTGVAATRRCTPQFAPLDTGTSSSASTLPYWRKEQAGDWGGGGWLGWTHDSKALVSVTMVVRDLPKRRTDDDDNVTVEAVPHVTFAVRCLGDIQPGTIRTAGVVNHSLTFDGVLRIPLGARRYEVRLRSRRDDLFDAAVVLSDGRRTQVLYTARVRRRSPFRSRVGGRSRQRWTVGSDRQLEQQVQPASARLLLSSRAVRDQLRGKPLSLKPATDTAVATRRMAPVLGYDKGCSTEIVEFVGIAV